MKARHKKLALIGGALAVIGIIAALVLNALNSNIALYISPTDVAEGKAPQSAEIVTKRIEGSVAKFLKEVSLFNQAFVKNDKQTVEQMLKERATQVNGFTLYVVGEGIEKKVDDFAAEVAAQVAAAKGA